MLMKYAAAAFLTCLEASNFESTPEPVLSARGERSPPPPLLPRVPTEPVTPGNNSLQPSGNIENAGRVHNSHLIGTLM